MNHSNASDLPREGDIIADKYRIERVLGAGGMGVVVAAQHVRLDEKVALKFLLPNALMNAEVMARFEREARAASKIKNEHVARVSDVGTLPNGSPYMVMEYLQGGDLSGWLQERGALPIDLAVDFVLQASEAIGEAHSLGIVHRDLKPANLFCIQRSDGQLFIKVLDFGISKLSTPGPDSHMTRTTAFLGSPLYMSPEQMQTSKGVDARTDLWSLGVILFELLAGTPPFMAESMTELAIRIATEPPMMLRSGRPDAPAGLEEVLAKCLQKDRNLRYQTVGELALALEPFAPPHARLSVDRIVGIERRAGIVTAGVDLRKSAVPNQLSPTQGGPGGPGATRSAPQTSANFGQTGAPAPSGRGNGLAIGIGVLVLMLAGLGGGLYVYKAGGNAANAAAAAAAPAATPAPAVSATSAPATPSAAPATPSAEPVAAAPPPTATTPAPPAAPAAAPPSPPPPPTPSPARTERAPQASPPAHAAPAPAKPAGKANCNPPYIINAAGEHQYKTECL